jgi:hypothetical protein
MSSVKAAVALAVLCLAGVSASVGAQQAFGDLQWGSRPTAVREHLSSQGYRYQGQSVDGEEVFGGRLMGHPASVLPIYADDKLVRVLVVIRADANRSLATYRAAVEQLSSIYGPPDRQVESYESPYAAGDGQEEAAIATDKATIGAVWDKAVRLTAVVQNDGQTAVAYDGPGWQADDARRHKRGGRGF